MPNTTDQSTDRSKRGALSILVVVAVIAVGLWYVLERPGTTESAGDAAPAAGDSRTADSGTAAERDSARTAGSDPATRIEESGTADAGTADSETRASADMARTTGPEASAPSESVRSAGTDTTDVPRPADSDTTGDAPRIADAGPETAAGRKEIVLAPVPAATVEKTPVDAPPAADSDTTGDAPRIADAGPETAASRKELVLAPVPAATVEKTPVDAPPAADSDTTGDALQIAATEPEAAGGRKEIVLAPVPAVTIEKTPIDAPPVADTTAETGILGAIERTIERMETLIQEQLATEPDSDPQLQINVTYDDSPEDAVQVGVEPTRTIRLADAGGTVSAGASQTPDSGVVIPADIAESTVSDGTAPPDANRTATADAIGDATADATGDATADATADAIADATGDATEIEAKKYVETLTDTAPQTIPVDKADHFVTRERVISLVPEDMIENVSVGELAKDETLSSHTPITVVREVEQIEDAVPEQLIAESGGDLDKHLRVRVTYDDSLSDNGQGDLQPGAAVPGQLVAESGGDVDEQLRVRVTYDDPQGDNGQDGSQPGTAGQPDVERITVREALERIVTEPKKPLSVIKKVRYFEVMTLKELLDSEPGDDTLLKVVTRPYRVESATLADLLQRQQTENPDSIFYLHTVQPTDDQGIWGIVHFGLIDNFARGMAIRRGEEVGTYTVRIPKDADERLDDQSSSFLGKLIDQKTKDSFVYNYRDHRMGRNPDRIYPGQEIVIIRFDPDELMSIYTQFATG